MGVELQFQRNEAPSTLLRVFRDADNARRTSHTKQRLEPGPRWIRQARSVAMKVNGRSAQDASSVKEGDIRSDGTCVFGQKEKVEFQMSLTFSSSITFSVVCSFRERRSATLQLCE